ncbi:uncharacterized LOC105372440 homolog [Choloepus didactylus]|uniref:uncharacterized LOC105372440 homolog n=1 Tax=Choloepus didactylus TaxID=27675 RepID=UPI00189CF10C|nr:uncharacterized LOC105372440 homolog [Choloepus didactylus]
MPFPPVTQGLRHHGHHSGLPDNPLFGSRASPFLTQRPRKETQVKTVEGSGSMAVNFQENVTLALAVFTILASIYFFNKAQQ